MNKFAISSGGIGEALMRSASSMSVANNTIDETIALVTAANTVVQDVSKVGNGLKTISMRIRGATTELADAGLETEGMAESTAKLQAEIKALSGVDIMLDKNNFKSTYQILDELAEKWHDLSDIAQASIVELLAGKHQGNTMSSLMENFDIAREAVKASLESEGSAMREHEKWLESLDAKLLQLQASWQSLSQTFLDSDFLKDLLDGVINVIDVVDVLLDKFGTIPTVLVGISTVLSAKNQGLVRTITDGKGAATGLGLNVFGSILSKETLHNFAKTQAMLNTFNTLSMQSAEAQSNFKKNIIDSDSSLGKYLRTVNQGDATINGYIKSVAGATAKTVAWKAATIALNSVLTIGATLLFNYAISSINSMIQAKEEARQVTMELATSAQEEAATISSAYNAYREATLAYDGTADSKNYLESVTQDLLTALGLEEDEINNLIERYGELDKAIDKVASDSLKERLTELYAGFDAVKESLVKSSREDGLFAWLDIFDLFKFDAGDFRFSVNSGFEEKMGNVLSNAGYNIAYKTKGNKIEGTFDSELPLNTAEDAVARYEQLTEMLQVLKDNASDSVNGLYTIEQLTSSDLYKQIDADRKLLEDEYKQYIAFKESINETVAQSKYIDYLDTYGSPDNYFEFEKMVVALEKTVVATDDFTGSQEDAHNVLLKTLGDVDTYSVWVDAYKEGLKEIPDATDQAIEDAIAHLKNGIREGINGEKLDSNEMAEIFNFFDNADGNTKEFIYRIAIQDDKTALWDLQQWQKEIQNIGECGLTSSEQMQHFYDIMNDTGESGLPTLIESYQAQINDLQTALTDLSHNRFDIVMKYPELAPYINDTDALREAIEELIDKANEDIFTYLTEQANQLKDVAPLAAESLLEVRDAIAEINANLPIDLDDAISKFEMLYEAINQSVSGTGLTTDMKQQLDAMFSELESYDPSKLFERTEHGIHLNVQEFRRLNKEYQDFNTDKIENELNQLSDEYDLVTAKLENLKAAGKEDTAEYSGLLREQDLLSQKIDANLDLMAQYKALTSDYNQWTMALSTADEDSMFANISNELANMKELYEKGRVGTDDFREFVQLMTDQDMSTASTDAIKEMYLKGLPVMEKFFTNSTDGLANFLNAVRTAGETLGGEALEWAKMTEDGNWTLNFGIGDDQKIAQAIEQVHGYAMSVEQVQILLRALSAYGFDINLDSAYTSLDTFNNRIEESKQKLQELGAEPVQIQTEFSDKESGLDVIENIKAKINEISNDATISPQVKTEQIALLNAELDKAYLKIVQFNDLPSLTIDSSQVQGEFMDLYDLMNKFNSKVNEMEILELKGLDTTAIQKDLDSVAAEISKFVSTVEGKEILSKLGIEIDDTSIQGVKDWFLDLQNQGVSIPFTVDTQGAIEEVQQLGAQFEEIVNDDGSIVTVRVQPDTSELQDLSKEKIDLNAKVTGDENIDKIVNAVMALEDKTIILTAETKGEDKVKTLEDTVKKVEDKTVNVVAEVQGDDDVEDLVEWIEEIPEEMLVAFEISGLEDIETIKLLIIEIQELEKVFEVGAEVYGTDDVIALKEAIDSLYDREVDVGADVYGEDAVWSLKASIDALQDKTVTVTTNYVTNYITNGSPSGGATGGSTTSGKYSGGARVDGTAFAEGNWGTQDSGVALMGELGKETIVRNGRFFTVGDNGAEFVKYKKNDIIFNAGQTEQLFKYGKIIHGKTRGRAIANGTAFAEGTAFSSGSGSLSNGGNTIIFGSGGSSGLGGSKGSSSGKSSSSKDDFEETFDWIEIAIDRIERAIARLDLKASSIFQSWTTRNTTLKQQISEINKEIDLQYQGYYRYIQEANSVGLSESWAKKVRDGAIDISTIKDEGLAEQIQKYQEWYEKALDCQDAIDELNETVSELYKQKFDNVVTEFEGMLAIVEHERSMLETFIEQSEAKGYVTSTKYYDALTKVENENIEELKKEKEELLASLKDSMYNGAVAKESEAWYEMIASIDEVTLAIEESETAILEYANAIREIEWQVFDLLQDKISRVADESDFLISLFEEMKLFDERGQLTNEGLSTMGLHGVNYNVYMAQADKYAEELAKLDEQIAKTPYDQELIDRREEMLELQRDSILGAEAEKEAMISLVEEGMEIELEALEELIDKKNESLEAEKDLYEYQKKVKDQTKEIASLEKQMAAYAGDDSEETKAKIQQLKVSLEEAKTNLEEMEYDKFIDDQEALFDELYVQYEEILNARLDNIDALILDLIAEVNANAETISSTILGRAESVGYEITDDMSSIWSPTEENANVLTTYGEHIENGIMSAATTVNETLKNMNVNLQTMIEELAKLADIDIDVADKSSAIHTDEANTAAKPKPVYKPPVYTPTYTPSYSYDYDDDYDYDYDDDDDDDYEPPKKETTTPKSSGKYVTGVEWEGKTTHTGTTNSTEKPKDNPNGKYEYSVTTQTTTTKYSDGSSKKETTKYYDVVDEYGNIVSGRYAKGVHNLSKDELAWTQEKGREFIVRPSDGAILTPLAQNDSVLTHGASNNIWDMANNPTEFIKDNLNLGVASIPNNNMRTNVEQHFDQIVFSMPNVRNYEEMLNGLRKDPNFERLVMAMTLDQIAGKSSLGKSKSIR